MVSAPRRLFAALMRCLILDDACFARKTSRIQLDRGAAASGVQADGVAAGGAGVGSTQGLAVAAFGCTLVVTLFSAQFG